MGAAKLSTKENKIETALNRSDFPKVKSSVISEESIMQQTLPMQSERDIPLYARISIGILIAQFALFVLTLFVINRRDTPVANHSNNEFVQYSGSSVGRSAILNQNEMPILKPTPIPKETRKKIAMFDEGELVNNAGVAIESGQDEISKRSLKVNLDSVNRIGSVGNALRIDYEFQANHLKPATFTIPVPYISASRFSKISFRIRGKYIEGTSPKMEIEVIDKEGVADTFLTPDIFSFWKRFTFNLNSHQERSSLGIVKELRFNIYPGGNPSKGTWYIDSVEMSVD